MEKMIQYLKNHPLAQYTEEEESQNIASYLAGQPTSGADPEDFETVKPFLKQASYYSEELACEIGKEVLDEIIPMAFFVRFLHILRHCDMGVYDFYHKMLEIGLSFDVIRIDGKQGSDLLKWYRKTLPRYEKNPGSKHLETAAMYKNIAVVYAKEYAYSKALSWCQKALAVYEKILGSEHPDTAAIYNDMGLIYKNMYNYPQALEFYHKALAVYEKELGTEHPKIAAIYSHIASVYHDQAQYNIALEWNQKAINLCEKILGRESLRTANTYFEMGMICYSMGNHSTALEWDRKTLAIYEKVLGKDHPKTADIYNNIATNHSCLGEHTAAREWHQKALDIREKVLGPEHLETADSYSNIGAICNGPEALKWYRKALPIQEKNLGQKHPKVAILYFNISFCYNKVQDVMKWLQKAWDTMLSSVCPKSLLAAAMRQQLDKAMSMDEMLVEYIHSADSLTSYIAAEQVKREKTKRGLNDYLLGKNATDSPENLPFLNFEKYRLKDYFVLMSAMSPVPARFVSYIILSQKGDKWDQRHSNNWFQKMIEGIRKVYGNKAAQEFIDKLSVPDDRKISYLIDACYEDKKQEWYKEQYTRIAQGNMDLIKKAYKAAEHRGAFLLDIYEDHPSLDPQWMLEALSDIADVRNIAMKFFITKKEYKEQIEALTKSKNKKARECAELLMKVYNSEEEWQQNYYAHLAHYHLNKSKAKIVNWTEFDTLPKVRIAGGDGTIVDDLIIRSYINLLLSAIDVKVSAEVLAEVLEIRKILNKEDLCALSLAIYHIWKNNGAKHKHRSVLILAALGGDDAFIHTLKADIQNWAKTSRDSLAAEAARVMALQGSDLALMTVDSMSKKFKSKQVQKAAGEAFHFAAQQLRMDPEVLGDRIIPDLGFDSQGRQTLDYGNRSFIATLSPTLSIELKNEDGKVIKSLPAPGVNDDQEKATEAKKTLILLKKNLKTIATFQCLRLERVMSFHRTWTKHEWAKLFVRNPIMHMFAMNLIWGIYDEESNLIVSFRYAEDGTFSTVDDEEIKLDDSIVSIGLCHPLELGDDLVSRWKEQLKDYNIQQPFAQLERKVYLLPPASLGSGESVSKEKPSNFGNSEEPDSVTKFTGIVIYTASLWGKLKELGWSQWVLYNGTYYNLYKEHGKQGIGACLRISKTHARTDLNEKITLYDLIFYKPELTEGYFDESNMMKQDYRLPLSQIPARLYSEICYDIERAVENRIPRKEECVT